MSEKKKRFFESLYSIFDRENGRKLQAYEIIDLLNELNEENQRLKNDCNILVQSNQEYRKENEQLKKRLEHYKEVEAMNGDGKNE